MFVTILCENFAPMSFGLMGEHGFAALIEAGDRAILYDTGQGIGLLNNAKILGKNLDGVDTVVLSHGHKDHTGGIPAFFDNYKARKLVAHPASFEKKFTEYRLGEKIIQVPIGISWQKSDFESKGVELKVAEGPLEIAPGLWFSGEVPAVNDFEKGDPKLKVETADGLIEDPFNDDAAIFIKTDKGLTVVCGCAHRGIINTINRALDVVGKIPVYAVIGGTHLIGASPERLNKTLEALRAFNPKIVAAGHCTSLECAAVLRDGLGDVFRFLSVGQRYEV